MLTKRETDYEIEYTEEEDQLTHNIGDLIIYNFERVGFKNVEETGWFYEDDTYYTYTFNYEGKSYEGDLFIGKGLAIGDTFIINTDTDEHKSLSFEIRLDLPPLNKAALTATSTDELVEALTSKEDWLRELAQKRFEVLGTKEAGK